MCAALPGCVHVCGLWGPAAPEVLGSSRSPTGKPCLGRGKATECDLLLGSDDCGQPLCLPFSSQARTGRHLAAHTTLGAPSSEAKGMVRGNLAGTYVPPEHGKIHRDMGMI